MEEMGQAFQRLLTVTEKVCRIG